LLEVLEGVGDPVPDLEDVIDFDAVIEVVLEGVTVRDGVCEGVPDGVVVGDRDAVNELVGVPVGLLPCVTLGV
jgi:hypothetical protein